VIFPDDYVKNKEHIKEENICFVRASVDRTREEPGLIINRILTVEQAQRELTRGLKLSLQSGVHEGNVVDAIANILKRTQGECPVYLEVSDSVGKRALLRLGHEYSVNVSRLQRADLEMVLGQGRISFLANGNGNANGRNGG
jgi:DNA polymerase-3 subunit alpha